MNIFVKKMSRKFTVEEKYDETVDNYCDVYVGTPSDIRKVMCYLERDHGMWSYYKEAPILREGRLYSIVAYDGDRTYSVSRVA